MKLILLGIDFPHAKGEFCRKITPPFYTLCRFATPFLYWKDGKLVRGEKGAYLINRPGQVVYHGPCQDAERGFVNDWMYISGEEMEQLLRQVYGDITLQHCRNRRGEGRIVILSEENL